MRGRHQSTLVLTRETSRRLHTLLQSPRLYHAEQKSSSSGWEGKGWGLTARTALSSKFTPQPVLKSLACQGSRYSLVYLIYALFTPQYSVYFWDMLNLQVVVVTIPLGQSHDLLAKNNIYYLGEGYTRA